MILFMVYAIWAGFFLSACDVFVARKMFGNPGSFLSAVVYQLLPFHLINLYFRGPASRIPGSLVLCLLNRGNPGFLGNTVEPSYAPALTIWPWLSFCSSPDGLLWNDFSGRERPVQESSHAGDRPRNSSVYSGPVLERKFIHMGVSEIYILCGIFLFDSRRLCSNLLPLLTSRSSGSGFFPSLFLLPKSSLRRCADTNRFDPGTVDLFYHAIIRAGMESILSFLFSSSWRWIIVMRYPVPCSPYFFSRRWDYSWQDSEIVIVIILVLLAQLPMQNVRQVRSRTRFLRLKSTTQWKITDEKPEYMPSGQTLRYCPETRRPGPDDIGAPTGN
jgi:hypothetical protein